MTHYLLRRLVGAVPLVLGIVTVIFFVFAAAPGGPVEIMVQPGMTAESAAALRANYGLDQPVAVRYLTWVRAMVSGDFGYSYSHGRPVLDVIGSALPNTLLLSGTAIVAALLLGVLLGAMQAVRQNSAFDSATSAVLLFFYSMPSFWLAVMLVLTLSVYAGTVWDWPISFPATGTYGRDYASLAGLDRILERARYLVLPATSLALVIAALIARYTRASMLEVIRMDFVTTARAKGLPERRVVFRHALRNALGPVVTNVGLIVPILLSGTVYIETIFGWPGMGKLMVDAIGQRDFALVMATSLVFSTMVVLGNLAADLVNAALDPRIRHE